MTNVHLSGLFRRTWPIVALGSVWLPGALPDGFIVWPATQWRNHARRHDDEIIDVTRNNCQCRATEKSILSLFYVNPQGIYVALSIADNRIGVAKGILSGRARVVKCTVEPLVLFFRQIQLRRRIAVIAFKNLQMNMWRAQCIPARIDGLESNLPCCI